MKHPEKCECEGTWIVSRAGFQVSCSKRWITREEADAILREEREKEALARRRQEQDERFNDIWHLYIQLLTHQGLVPSAALDRAIQAIDFWNEKKSSVHTKRNGGSNGIGSQDR